jgi:DNA-binding MarR family transcriptional regulator
MLREISTTIGTDDAFSPTRKVIHMFHHDIDRKRRTRYSPDDFRAIRDDCVATNIGKANRIVSRIYEEAFRDMEISSPQFALLVSLTVFPDSTASHLAEALSADPSTVSRNTELLIKRGLIAVRTGEDRRVRTYALTPAGAARVQACVPRWRSAQRTALRKIGRGRWREVRRTLGRLTF